MIPVNEPRIAPNALEYVTDCLESGWISSAGHYIERFENAFASYIGVKHAVTTTSGTAALHLALASLGIGKGDEVIVPALTMIAVPFAVMYTGANFVAIDVEPDIYNISPEKIEHFIEKYCKYDSKKERLTNRVSGKIVKAVIPAHLYGHPCDMAAIIDLSEKYRLSIIEDAAEAHGAEYLGKISARRSGENSTSNLAGSMGDVSCFSFYANKIVTTGEGGMLVTNDESIANRARVLKNLAHSPSRRFHHTDIGFNYRMTNIQAAIGLAQLEEIQNSIQNKRRMAQSYHGLLRDLNGLQLPVEKDWAKSVYWMYTVLLKPDLNISQAYFMKRLREAGIDTRTFFAPLDEQPVFNSTRFQPIEDYPVCRSLSKRGLYLPSGLAITDNQIDRVCKAIRKILAER